jgi:hypothetical protein
MRATVGLVFSALLSCVPHGAARGAVCSLELNQALSELRVIEQSWDKLSEVRLIVNSIGSRNTRPAPVPVELMEATIERHRFVQEIQMHEPLVMKEILKALESQEWTPVEERPGSLDIRFRLAISVREAERFQWYVTKEQRLVFGACVFKTHNSKWFQHLWRLILAEDTFAP